MVTNWRPFLLRVIIPEIFLLLWNYLSQCSNKESVIGWCWKWLWQVLAIKHGLVFDIFSSFIMWCHDITCQQPLYFILHDRFEYLEKYSLSCFVQCFCQRLPSSRRPTSLNLLSPRKWNHRWKCCLPVGLWPSRAGVGHPSIRSTSQDVDSASGCTSSLE